MGKDLKELKLELEMLTTNRSMFLISSYWLKVGDSKNTLSDYIKACDEMGYSEQDKEEDNLYQLAKEISAPTKEEETAFLRFHNLLRDIISFCEKEKQQKFKS